MNNLSPWKGGGFGMFAAIDAPDMRVLKVDGITTQDDTIKIDVPFSGNGEYGPYTNSLELELLTMPTESGLKSLAELLVNDSYSSHDEGESMFYEHLNTPLDTTEQIPGDYYRPFYSYESPNGLSDIVELKSVRLQLLRIIYKSETHSLVYEEYLQPYSASR